MDEHTDAATRAHGRASVRGGWERRERGYWAQSWQRLKEDRLGLISGAALIALCLIAVSADLWTAYITHHTAEELDLSNVFGPLSESHWLGTDELGRDTLTRLVFGARITLIVGFLTVALSLLIGGAVGLVAGYYGRWIDEVLMRVVDVLLALPTIYLLILMTSLLPLPIGPAGRPWFVARHDAVSISVVLAITGWPPLARLVRGEVLSLTRREFILAARSVGVTDTHLILKHVFPNVVPVMVVSASLGLGFVILAEAALDFIGLGVQPPIPSWGNMLRNAQTYFYESVALAVLPGLAIVITVIAANILGNALRDALDPRLR